HYVRHAHDASDRHDIADEIEIELLVERRVDCCCRLDQQERVSVRHRLHDRFGADISASSWPVFDDERLAKPLRQCLTKEACYCVAPAASSKADDQTHRARRIGLRPREARNDGKRGGVRGQMYEFAPAKFHSAASWKSSDRHSCVCLK